MFINSTQKTMGRQVLCDGVANELFRKQKSPAIQYWQCDISATIAELSFKT